MKWRTKDGRVLSPSEMTVSHQINCIRMYTRKLMAKNKKGYYICAEAICAQYPIFTEMAINIRTAGMDPYKDYGAVLTDINADSDYPLSDIVTDEELKNGLKPRVKVRKPRRKKDQ